MDAPPCPLCGGPTAEAFTVGDRNRELTSAQFSYRRCLKCHVLFLENLPPNLGDYYPEDYYGLPSLEQLDEVAKGEEPRLAMIRSHAPRGKLVEIGPASGVFSRAAQTAGYDVSAIEMDARCCEFLSDVVGIEAICSNSPEDVLAGIGPIGVLAMWHVLEHLPRPWDVLTAAAAALESGGTIALATPNPESFQFRLLGARWAHVDAPRHLFLIPLATLRARMDELGFDLRHQTTSDPSGRYWNAFGWEYAIRVHPARHGPSRFKSIAARVLALLLAPVERRGMRGTAYTVVFVKR